MSVDTHPPLKEEIQQQKQGEGEIVDNDDHPPPLVVDGEIPVHDVMKGIKEEGREGEREEGEGDRVKQGMLISN